ncbi:uncharacterized protein [Misgurnus anguillicaudatus]|uniref:uncharacterized protein isoform X2 n=1 Tax=Misgurnus anguillicaudatus TaxID=75329 RepID=UPI003CCF0AA3
MIGRLGVRIPTVAYGIGFCFFDRKVGGLNPGSCSHDKLFAHWTNESMDLLKGHRQPVMHLRKCKLKEIEALSVEEQGQRLPVISVDDPKVTFLYHQISFLLQKHHKMQISLCCLFQALRVEEEEEPPVKTMNIEDMQEASNLVAQLKEQNLFKR